MTVTDVDIEYDAAVVDAELLNRPHDVRVEGGRAYVAGKGGTFAVVDTGEMRVLGGLTCFDDAQVVCPVAPDCCYVGDAQGVFAVDVADPTDPTVVASIERPSLGLLNGWDRWGPYLVGASKRGYIGVVDVADPADPTFAGERDTLATSDVPLSRDDRTDFEERDAAVVRSPHDVRVVGHRAVVPDQHPHADRKLGVYDELGIRNVYGAGLRDRSPDEEFRRLFEEITDSGGGSVHPGPDAPTPGDDTTHPTDWRDVLSTVLSEIEDRQRAFWTG